MLDSVVSVLPSIWRSEESSSDCGVEGKSEDKQGEVFKIFSFSPF